MLPTFAMPQRLTTRPSPAAIKPSGLKIQAIQPQLRSSQIQPHYSRDMRAFGQQNINPEDFNTHNPMQPENQLHAWTSMFRKNQEFEDQDAARDLDDLMNHHLGNLRNQPPKNPSENMKHTQGYEHLQCFLLQDDRLTHALGQLDEKLTLFSPEMINHLLSRYEEILWNEAHDLPNQELLLPGKNAQCVRLTVEDQKNLAHAIVELMPFETKNLDAETRQALINDPRNQVLFLKEGTSLDELRNYLSKHFPLNLTPTVWKEFTPCIPCDDELVKQSMGINLWSLYDLCIQAACEKTLGSPQLRNYKPLNDWLVQGQNEQVFDQSLLSICRSRIIDDLGEVFLKNLIRFTLDGVNPQTLKMIDEVAVPKYEQAMVQALSETKPTSVPVDTNEFAGSAEFAKWYRTQAGRLLDYCDRDQPISLVSPADDRWQAKGINPSDLPLVMINKGVNARAVSSFLDALGGDVLQANGKTKWMMLMNNQTKRDQQDGAVYSIAELRDQLTVSFIQRLLIQPEVAMAREFHEKMLSSNFPRAVTKYTLARYENAIRSGFGQLYNETNKPCLLFAVPKLYDFLEQVIDYSLQADGISHFALRNAKGKNPIQVMLEQHLKGV